MSVGIERALAACTTHLPNWVRGKTRPPQVALAGRVGGVWIMRKP